MIDRKLQLHFLLILLAGALYLSFLIFRPFLTPLVLAAVFAVVLHPLYRGLVSRLGNWESVAALLTVLISVVLILIPLVFLGTQIVREAGQLYGSIAAGDSGANFVAATIQNIGHAIGDFSPAAGNFFTGFSADVDIYLKQGLEWLIQHLGAALSGITALFLNFFIFFIALYYLLRDGVRLKRALIVLSPLEDTDDEMIFGRLETAVNSVIKGSLTIALVQGVLTAIGFAIFGVPNAILWGTIAAVASLIPGFGTALVLVPAVLYLFATGDIIPAIGLLAWGTLGVGLIDNFLGPRLVSKSTHLHPLLILLSVLGGLVYFGPIGIFLGPLILSLLFAFIAIYSYLANPSVSVADTIT